MFALQNSLKIGGLLLVLVATPAAWGQRGGANEAERWVLMTHEVDDLVLDVRDQPYFESSGAAARAASGFGFSGSGGAMYGGGGMGGGGFGGVVPGNSTATAQADAQRPVGGGSDTITMRSLRDVIMATVEAESWAVAGGEGQIQALGTTLVIWQTSRVQHTIGGLLDQLRKGSGDRATLRVDARWLLLDSDDLARLAPRDDEGRTTIDRETLDKFTRRPGSIRGITNCFSGQLVYVVSGTRRNIVRSFIPVVGSLDAPEEGIVHLAARKLVHTVQFGGGEGGMTMGRGDSKVGYQPIVETPNFGTLLEIRPALMRRDNSVVVEVKSTITVSAEPESDPSGAAGFGMAPSVDRVAIETQELATSLRMPLDEPVLVGGLTYAPVSSTVQPGAEMMGAVEPPDAETERSQMYFVLEVTRADR